MKIKLRAVHASPRGIFHPGTILDLDETEARALVAGDYADLIEQAVRTVPERAEAEPARATTALAAEEAAALRRVVNEPAPPRRRHG